MRLRLKGSPAAPPRRETSPPGTVAPAAPPAAASTFSQRDFLKLLGVGAGLGVASALGPATVVHAQAIGDPDTYLAGQLFGPGPSSTSTLKFVSQLQYTHSVNAIEFWIYPIGNTTTPGRALAIRNSGALDLIGNPIVAAGAGSTMASGADLDLANNGLLNVASITSPPSGATPSLVLTGYQYVDHTTSQSGTWRWFGNNTSAQVTVDNAGNLTANGTLQAANIALTSAPPAGSVMFEGAGVMASNGAQFHWDNTNFRLGLLTNVPASALSVGAGSLFQVSSAGAVVAATGLTSSGPITFSGLSTNGGLLFTNGSGVLAQTGASQMFWNSATGQLGIGTASPGFAVEIMANGAPQLALRGSWGGGAAYLRMQETNQSGFWDSITRNANAGLVGNWDWYCNPDGVNNQNTSHYHQYMSFLANNSLDTTPGNVYFAGNIGIGTIVPQYPLDIASNQLSGWSSGPMRLIGAQADVMMHMVNTNGGRDYCLDSSGTLSGLGAGKFMISDAGYGAVRLAIDSSGNVGIGTPWPQCALYLAGGVFQIANTKIADSSGCYYV